MLSYVSNELGELSKRKTEKMRKKLCDILGTVGHPPAIVHVLQTGTWLVPIESELTVLKKLLAALCAGHWEPVIRLMEELPDFHGHSLFGDPLVAATPLGHKKAVRSMLRFFKNEARHNISFGSILRPWKVGGNKDSGFLLTEAMKVAIH